MLCLFSSLKICRKRKVLTHARVTRITEVTPKEQQYLGLSVDYLAHEGRGLDAVAWFAVLEALVTEAGDPDRAMELGRRWPWGRCTPR
mgnify:CR=1 FL=1